MRFLITGHAGFLGSRLTALLDTKADHTWSGYDIVRDNAHTVQNEIRLREFTFEARPDMIIHLAGPVDAYMTSDPAHWFKVQIDGTWNVLNAAADVGAQVLLASSFYVYEGIDAGQIVNEERTLSPDQMGLFGLAKYTAERLCVAMENVSTARLRFGSMYGGGGSNVADNLIEKGRAGKVLDIWGKGDRVHQFTHVEDVAVGIIRVAESELGGTWNLISPHVITTKGFAELLANHHGYEFTFDESKPEGVSFPYMSSRLAENKLDWRPRPLMQYIGSMEG